MKKKVDFIGIGAQKSGTTWLFNCLNQIDQFTLPPQKEFHYFSKNPKYPSPNHLSSFWSQTFHHKKSFLKKLLKKPSFWNGKNFYLSSFFLKKLFLEKNDKWYLSNFENLNGFTGEITPAYSMLDEKDIKHMYELLPDVKLIFLVRNPIDRAWSAYKSIHKKELTKSSSLDNQKIIKYMKENGQILRSNYMRTIDLYSKSFQDNQILVCFFDAITNHPELLIKDIADHICGKDKIIINHLNFNKKVNPSIKIDMPEEVHNYLKLFYHDQIKELSETYGGYFSKWYEEKYNENKLIKINNCVSSFLI